MLMISMPYVLVTWLACSTAVSILLRSYSGLSQKPFDCVVASSGCVACLRSDGSPSTASPTTTLFLLALPCAAALMWKDSE